MLIRFAWLLIIEHWLPIICESVSVAVLDLLLKQLELYLFFSQFQRVKGVIELMTSHECGLISDKLLVREFFPSDGLFWGLDVSFLGEFTELICTRLLFLNVGSESGPA
jgi:hypothetical protein